LLASIIFAVGFLAGHWRVGVGQESAIF
jgi:hypothetical protein